LQIFQQVVNAYSTEGNTVNSVSQLSPWFKIVSTQLATQTIHK